MPDGIALARALLTDDNGKPTAKYQAYLNYEAEYNRVASQYDNARNTAAGNPMLFHRWPITGKQYSDEVTAAMNKWMALGYKHEIENALNILKSTNGM